MNTREKAARDLCALDGIDPDAASLGKDMKTRRAWENRLPAVDAVLNAIREPTQGQLLTLGLLSGAGPQPRAVYVAAWQAMIDSILKGEG